jgi:AcrR family transcriptional regulator
MADTTRRQREQKPKRLGRPKVPLLKKSEILARALKIVDEEGLDALNIRRLAGEFDVNVSSFYYHFKNKEDILVGLAELAFGAVRLPRVVGDDWQDWLLHAAKNYRKALLAHPELIPIILRAGHYSVGAKSLDLAIGRLEDQGVSSGTTVELIQSIEMVAIGSVLYERSTRMNGPIPPEMEVKYPRLDRALKNRSLKGEERFEILCRNVIAGISTRFQ